MSLTKFTCKSDNLARACEHTVALLARANSVRLLALSRSDRRVLASLLVRVEWAVLCRAELVEQRKQRNSGRFLHK